MDLGYPKGATPLDPDELEGFKFSHVTTRADLDELEAANISQGFLWLQRRRNPQILSDGFAREFHRRLFGEVWDWAGTYRKTEKNIGIDPIYVSVKVRELMDDVKYWIENDVYEPVELAVRFHHQLVYIHPFPNGNGRHARYMADAVMEHIFGTAPLTWGTTNDLISESENRDRYIKSLRCADRGSLDELLAFVSHQESGG